MMIQTVFNQKGDAAVARFKSNVDGGLIVAARREIADVAVVANNLGEAEGGLVRTVAQASDTARRLGDAAKAVQGQREQSEKAGAGQNTL